MTTFHKIHPEILDYWISLKFDDQKNKALVQEELQELLRRRRKAKTRLLTTLRSSVRIR